MQSAAEYEFECRVEAAREAEQARLARRQLTQVAAVVDVLGAGALDLGRQAGPRLIVRLQASADALERVAQEHEERAHDLTARADREASQLPAAGTAAT